MWWKREQVINWFCKELQKQTIGAKRMIKEEEFTTEYKNDI